MCRGWQQKVSRFHNRQLRFSNLLPSSIACDVFENSDHCVHKLVSGTLADQTSSSTYHSKEIFDRTCVDCVQRRHFDAQQRMLWSERHDGVFRQRGEEEVASRSLL